MLYAICTPPDPPCPGMFGALHIRLKFSQFLRNFKFDHFLREQAKMEKFLSCWDGMNLGWKLNDIQTQTSCYVRHADGKLFFSK